MTKLEQAARQACQTPLKDLLRSVPKDGRDCYEEDSTCHHFIPYGRLIHEALAEIERLEALAEQAEQEPVAFQMICPRCKVDRVTTPCPRGGVSDCPMTATAQNAAPVRTKDLTDDEIEEIGKSYFDEWSFGFARAVITADREKNK